MRPGDGFRRRLQAYGSARASDEGVAGEAGGVGERVEDVAPGGMGGDPQSVLALVEIEAGLVALPERDADLHRAFFHDHVVGAVLVEPGTCGIEALEGGLAGFVGREHGNVADGLPKGADEVTAAPRHPQREALNDGDRAVAVHDEPGQAVGLTPDEPAECWQRSVFRATGNSHRDAPAQQRIAHGLIPPRHHPTAERGAGVVEATANEAAGNVDDGHDRARLDVADVRHVPFEDPGVDADTGVSATLEPEDRRLHAASLPASGRVRPARTSTSAPPGCCDPATAFAPRRGRTRSSCT